jgi:hypothetical protein
LTRDAGYAVVHGVENGDEFVSSDFVIDRGPHPDAESDFALFCEVMSSALGLSSQPTPDPTFGCRSDRLPLPQQHRVPFPA